MADGARKSRPTLPFDEVADHYDRGRPSYPDALVDDVLDLCDLSPARVLEVGARTGKATELFAERNLEILAIEPSPKMAAAAARRRCAGFPLVSVLVAKFEECPVEPEQYGLLISAQAWHWVAPEVRYQKAHRVLSPSGGLALFWSRPLWEQSALGAALAEVYEARAPELHGYGPWFPGSRGPHAAEKPTEPELAGYFGPVTECVYRWALDYTVGEYLELVQSLPEHLALSASRRAFLFGGLAEVIEGTGRALSLDYETRLYFAARAG